MTTTRKAPSGIVLQPRDYDILRGLFESRVMKLEHLLKLYFDGKEHAARSRLKTLRAAKLIRTRGEARVGEELIFCLTPWGFDALQNDPELPRIAGMTWENMEKRLTVSTATLTHELEVLDLKAALTVASRDDPQVQLEEFSTWPWLYQFTTPHYATKNPTLTQPDGYIRLIERQPDGETHDFFVEHDRSSEERQRLISKALAYQYFYRSGGFAERCGRSRSDFRECLFQALYVLQSPARCYNLAEKLLQLPTPIKHMVRLTTYNEFVVDPFGAIWFAPAEYLDATEGTIYDPRKHKTEGTLKPRDLVVAGRIRKSSLIQ